MRSARSVATVSTVSLTVREFCSRAKKPVRSIRSCSRSAYGLYGHLTVETVWAVWYSHDAGIREWRKRQQAGIAADGGHFKRTLRTLRTFAEMQHWLVLFWGRNDKVIRCINCTVYILNYEFSNERGNKYNLPVMNVRWKFLSLLQREFSWELVKELGK